LHFEYYYLTSFLVHCRVSAEYNVSEVVTSRYLSAAVETCYFTLRLHTLVSAVIVTARRDC